jgi:hypothetical protein
MRTSTGRTILVVLALFALFLIGWWAVKLAVSFACYAVIGLVIVGAVVYLFRGTRRSRR